MMTSERNGAAGCRYRSCWRTSCGRPEGEECPLCRRKRTSQQLRATGI